MTSIKIHALKKTTTNNDLPFHERTQVQILAVI